jgi:dipeptidyl aminopeptidase/acylaminoacyl peptidase
MKGGANAGVRPSANQNARNAVVAVPAKAGWPVPLRQRGVAEAACRKEQHWIVPRELYRAGVKISSIVPVVGLVGAMAFSAPPPAEDFSRLPEYGPVKISPDGTSVALLHQESRGGVVLIHNIAQKHTRRFESWEVYDGDSTRPTAGIQDFHWLTPTRMLFRTEASYLNDYTYAEVYRANVEAQIQAMPVPSNMSPEQFRDQVLIANRGNLALAESQLTEARAVSGVFAADVDGNHRIEMPGVSKDGRAGIGEAYHIWDFSTLRVSRLQPGSLFVAYSRVAWNGHPHLGRFDSDNEGVFVKAENPGMVDEWLVDWSENPSVGVEYRPTTTKLWHKPPAAKKWVELADLGARREQLRFHGFDAGAKTLYISRSDRDGTSALYGYNLESHQWGEPQVHNSGYDAAPADHRLSFAEQELTAPVFSRAKRDLIGVRFVTDGPRQQWFDPARAAVQRALDAARPGHVNMIVAANDAEDRFVVLSWSARNPGSYGLFDSKTSSYVALASRMGWIKPAEMGETFPFKCRTADGLTLGGYVTKPPGETNPAPRLPLVVLLREEPWRRDVWGFDPWVQFLATRGYAVLQVNYRGSFGYGAEFHRKGVEQVGGIDADIQAAVGWAIKTGVADAKRVAIVGRGFGGSCALVALARASSVYHCAVAIDSVVDWVDTLKKGGAPARRFWMDTAGLFSATVNDERLRELSPLNMVPSIAAPVLLIHATTSQHAPIRGVKAFAEELEKSGRKPETYFYGPNRSRDGVEKDGAEVFRKIEAFLAAHLQSQPGKEG